jgi:hypothetical protein
VQSGPSIARVRAVLTTTMAACLVAFALSYGVASPPSYDETVSYLPSIAYVQARFPHVILRDYGPRSPAGPPLWFAVQASFSHLLGRSPVEALPFLRALNVLCALGAFLILSFGPPLAPTRGRAAFAVLATAAAVFGGPLLLDVFRIKQVFPGWLLAAPVIVALRVRGGDPNVQPRRPRAWAGVLFVALTMWTNQIVGVVLAACAAASLTREPLRRLWPPRMLTPRARVLVALLLGGCVAGLALLLFWGGTVPPASGLMNQFHPGLARRVVAPMVTTGCLLGIWSFAFVRRLPRAALVGAAALGLAAMFVFMPPQRFGQSFVGIVGGTLTAVEAYGFWAGRGVQGAAVALCALVVCGLLLGRPEDERPAGLSLVAVLVLFAAFPYLSDRYYVIGLGPWFAASGLPVLERQYGSWGPWARRAAGMVVFFGLAVGIGYAVFKLRLAYSGVLTQ